MPARIQILKDKASKLGVTLESVENTVDSGYLLMRFI